MKTLLILTTLCLFMACKKDKPFIDPDNFHGVWVNQSNNIDTLFWSETDIYRTDETSSLPTHHYTYTLFLDSIGLEYKGEDYIHVIPKSFRITIDDAQLTIEGIEDYYPYVDGDEFVKLR